MIQKELALIVELLLSDNVGEIQLALDSLDAFMHELVSSIKNYHYGSPADSRLLAFLQTQESFQYNLALAFVSVYRTISESDSQVQIETILLANKLLLGILLIHPSSRTNFGIKRNMELVILFLDPESPYFLIEVCISFMSLLIHILLQNVKNMRVFEQCGGCQKVLRHLEPLAHRKDSELASARQHLYFKVIEFLIFYLTDEAELAGGPGKTRTIEEKASLVRPEFPGIDDLIDNLNDLTSLS